MNNSKIRNLKGCLRRHKKEILLTAGLTMIVIGIALTHKKGGRRLIDSLRVRLNLIYSIKLNKNERFNKKAYRPIQQCKSNQTLYAIKSSHFVRQHLRVLPNGQKASKKKLAEMQALGLCCPENVTLVDQYYTGRKVA